MSFKEYKCPRCGGVHAAVPLDVAQRHEATVADYESFFRCFNCGAPSHEFVPAQDSDCMTGVTIQCVVVPGVFEDNRWSNPQVAELTARLTTMCTRKRVESSPLEFDEFMRDLDARLKTYGWGVNPEEADEVMTRVRSVLTEGGQP